MKEVKTTKQKSRKLHEQSENINKGIVLKIEILQKIQLTELRNSLEGFNRNTEDLANVKTVTLNLV